MEGMFNIFTVYSLICVFLPCLLYQLVLVYGGHGAIGGRGQAVFGTCLADGKRARWEQSDGTLSLP